MHSFIDPTVSHKMYPLFELDACISHLTKWYSKPFITKISDTKIPSWLLNIGSVCAQLGSDILTKREIMTCVDLMIDESRKRWAIPANIESTLGQRLLLMGCWIYFKFAIIFCYINHTSHHITSDSSCWVNVGPTS